MIAIIDYGAGNLKSVEKALSFLGEESRITGDGTQILSADKVILPGVGAFGDAMRMLGEKGLIDVIREVIESGVPFLGICLGLQLFFESSEESPGTEGLGILKGRILKLPERAGYKIPQIGWNTLSLKNEGRLFRGIEAEPYVYFVHSYYLRADDCKIVTACTDYTACIHASVEEGNIFACQFHPEKSGDVGLRMLKNFTEI